MAAQRSAAFIAASIALALASFAARSAITELAWDAKGSMERQLEIAPGKFAEICGKLGAADVVTWQFEASAPVDFNIHFHEGDKVEYPERQDSTRALSGTFRPAAARDYCWMWTNRGAAAVKASVRLRR